MASFVVIHNQHGNAIVQNVGTIDMLRRTADETFPTLLTKIGGGQYPIMETIEEIVRQMYGLGENVVQAERELLDRLVDLADPMPEVILKPPPPTPIWKPS